MQQQHGPAEWRGETLPPQLQLHPISSTSRGDLNVISHSLGRRQRAGYQVAEAYVITGGAEFLLGKTLLLKLLLAGHVGRFEALSARDVLRYQHRAATRHPARTNPGQCANSSS